MLTLKPGRQYSTTNSKPLAKIKVKSQFRSFPTIPVIEMLLQDSDRNETLLCYSDKPTRSTSPALRPRKSKQSFPTKTTLAAKRHPFLFNALPERLTPSNCKAYPTPFRKYANGVQSPGSMIVSDDDVVDTEPTETPLA